MLAIFVIAVFGAMIGLVAYELVDEARGGSNELHDRYHE